MTVRIHHSKRDGLYKEYLLIPKYDSSGRLEGYNCSNNNLWYGSLIFQTDVENGTVEILKDLTPLKEIKKLSFI